MTARQEKEWQGASAICPAGYAISGSGKLIRDTSDPRRWIAPMQCPLGCDCSFMEYTNGNYISGICKEQAPKDVAASNDIDPGYFEQEV